MKKKVALVTHALDYVGPPAVTALHNEGYEVIAYDPAFAEQDKKAHFKEKHPGSYPTDIADPHALIQHIGDVYEHIDVVISNDPYQAIHTPVEEAKLEDLSATLQHLLIYPFSLMQAVIPKLKSQGGGNIIMVTSCRTELPQPGGAIPDMARAGANALVKSLSIELAPFGIPVNAIAPNYLYSEAYFPKAKFIDDPEGKAFIAQQVPAGRLGTADEMGELIRYLANMQGAFHTGTVIKFSGGWPASLPRPR